MFKVLVKLTHTKMAYLETLQTKVTLKAVWGAALNLLQVTGNLCFSTLTPS